MKKRILITFMALATLLIGFVSCSKDDDSNVGILKVVINTWYPEYNKSLTGNIYTIDIKTGQPIKKFAFGNTSNATVELNPGNYVLEVTCSNDRRPDTWYKTFQIQAGKTETVYLN